MFLQIFLGMAFMAGVSSSQVVSSPPVAQVQSPEQSLERMLQAADEVLETRIPDPFVYDAQGRMDREHQSPAFIAWVDANHMDRGEVLKKVNFDMPGIFLYLGYSTDPRVIAVLRRALSSRRVLFQTYAALGIARERDYDSVPLVLKACRDAPSDAASLIATALLQFRDPEVMREAMPYFSPEVKKMVREGKYLVPPPFSGPALIRNQSGSR